MRALLTRILPGVLTVALFVLAPVGVDPASADDDEDERSEAVRLPAGKVVNQDYFAAGDVVEIAGTVNGDVYVAGGEVLIAGTVNGDLLAAGGTVTMAGTVSQDVRMVGGEVTIDGRVGRNVTLAGGSIDVTKAAAIDGSLVVAGGKLRLAAPVAHDARLAAGTVTISDRVGGHLRAAVGTLRLTSTAAVGGDLIYVSGEPPSLDPQVEIGGKVVRKELPEDLRPSPGKLAAALAGLWLTLWLASLVSTLVLGLLLLRFYPNAIRTGVDHLRTRPMASLGIGVLASLLIPFLAFLFAVTIVGFPLALIVIAWYLLVLYLGRILVMQWIGEGLLRRFGREAGARGAFVLGLTVYFVVSLIPFVGGLLTGLAILLGLGSTLYAKKAIYSEAREQAMI